MGNRSRYRRSEIWHSKLCLILLRRRKAKIFFTSIAFDCTSFYLYISFCIKMTCLEEGMTQISERSPGPRPHFVWNFPIDITFRSTNPYGWPQLVVTLYSSSGKNKSRVLGYGWTHVPCFGGEHRKSIPLFMPRSSSTIQSIIGAIQGKQAEFIDPSFVARGEGREITRVKSEGSIHVNFNVVTKNMLSNGLEEPRQ